MRILFLLSAMLLFAFQISAQTENEERIDSLLKLIRKDKTDSLKVYHLNIVSNEYFAVGMNEKAFRFARRAVLLSETTGNEAGLALSYCNLFALYKATGEIDSALTYYNKFIQTNQHILDVNELIRTSLELSYWCYYNNRIDEAGTLFMLASTNAAHHADKHKLRKDLFNLSIPDSEAVCHAAYLSHIRDYMRAHGIIQDSLLASQQKQELYSLQQKLEADKREAILAHEKQMTEMQLKQQFLLTKEQEQKILLTERESELAEKDHNIQSLEYQRTKEELVHQKILAEITKTENEKNEARVQLLSSEKRLQQNEISRQKIMQNGLIGGLTVVILFASVVLVQRTRISKGKKRSDELLLNILPAETAEELKATGAAKAKSYDEVTVMFTDFKNFTQVSEKLSVDELVHEINYCYSEFDKIIARHNIEKIKTIGDSYMCAGGLPVANQTNAMDTVRAALEIQEFMKLLKEKKTSEGKLFFELRLGLNTGPVVAGIVGIKKFAYDIWGDTVNIASRMESSGEVGKVNISGATYEMVKDQFNCIYRGKIDAKNKGLIDMYFVEGHIATHNNGIPEISFLKQPV